DPMPEPYRAALETPWNRWLQTRYASQAALEKAWNVAVEPLGGELLRDGAFGQGLGSAWFLEQHEGAKASATVAKDGNGLRVQVEKQGREGWHVQLSQSKIAFTQGQSYTLAFRAKATGGRGRVIVGASQAHAPWKQLWSATAVLTPEWKDYSFAFQPSAGDDNARIVFSNLSAAGTDFGFANVSLRTGGRFGLQEGERLGAVPIFKKSGYGARTEPAQHDWMRFLWETEDGYWTGMQRFLKEEIKTRSLLVGTAVGYSLAPLQAKLDVVDSHAYWQHPHFPGKSWDPANWTVRNVSMAGDADGGILPELAFRRVEGKPYICTEYNTPAPNSYAAETFLLSNAFAGFQDWDGVFAFAYSHRSDDWDSRRISNFFDIDQNPSKLATLPAAVAMFVRGDVAKAPVTKTVPVSWEQAIERCMREGSWWNLEAFGLKKTEAFTLAAQMRTGESPAAPEPSAATGTASPFSWDSAHARVTVNSPRSKAFVGPGTGEAVALGDVTVAVQGWAALALTAMDGRDFHTPGRLLITAVGSVESTGMRWKNAEKNTVGQDWGTAPTVAEGITARVTLPVPASRLKAWALDERGQRGKEIGIRPEGAGAALDLGPEHRTLWYEVEIRP
ncbi:MAG: carbohydrate binding domain-containing protein, partial [Chthoniobacteraceae bacterium]|nr:carbohydrate binding domain-containing protein [Chthoniobacteraceae bacterium]